MNGQLLTSIAVILSGLQAIVGFYLLATTEVTNTRDSLFLLIFALVGAIDLFALNNLQQEKQSAKSE